MATRFKTTPCTRRRWARTKPCRPPSCRKLPPTLADAGRQDQRPGRIESHPNPGTLGPRIATPPRDERSTKCVVGPASRSDTFPAATGPKSPNHGTKKSRAGHCRCWSRLWGRRRRRVVVASASSAARRLCGLATSIITSASVTVVGAQRREAIRRRPGHRSSLGCLSVLGRRVCCALEN